MEFTLCVVDDALPARHMIKAVFGKEYRVVSFESAEACLEGLADGTLKPNVFLLDVDLPGINGFNLCRRIKALPELSSIPAIFVSGLDDLESRAEGYDAGGLDFIVKPVSLPELRHKISAAHKVHEERVQFWRDIEASKSLSALVMSNLDEQAILIKFLRSLNACEAPRRLIDALLELARAYGLRGAVQVRLPDFNLTASDEGDNRPLEVSVINHVLDQGRIFEFKNRCVYNFGNVTLLVNNMPLHDPDLCGRVRDHLAIATESAQAKLQALQDKRENVQARKDVVGLIAALEAQVRQFDETYSQVRFMGASVIAEMAEQLASSFAALGMSDEQEHRLIEFVENRAEALVDIYDAGADTQAALSDIAQRLAAVVAGMSEREQPVAESSPSAANPQEDGIELF